MERQNQNNSSEEKELVDLELNCLTCQRRLYAPLSAAKQVVATVNSGNTAILLCPHCGQGNVIRRNITPKVND